MNKNTKTKMDHIQEGGAGLLLSPMPSQFSAYRKRYILRPLYYSPSYSRVYPYRFYLTTNPITARKELLEKIKKLRSKYPEKKKTSISTSDDKGKWIWGSLPSSSRSGLIYKSGSTTKYFSGSGIILIENYQYRPTIILFESSNYGRIYSETGGYLEKKGYSGKQILEESAKRETKEESYGLFNLKNRSLYNKKYVDIRKGTSKHNYRCYFMFINKIPFLSTTYAVNRKIILNHPNSPSGHWFETKFVTRVYTSEIARVSGYDRRAGVRDVYGNLISVSARTLLSIKKVMEKYGKNVFKEGMKNRETLNRRTPDSSSPSYLMNTTQYT